MSHDRSRGETGDCEMPTIWRPRCISAHAYAIISRHSVRRRGKGLFGDATRMSEIAGTGSIHFRLLHPTTPALPSGIMHATPLWSVMQ